MTDDLVGRLGALRSYLRDLAALVAAEADAEPQDGDAASEIGAHIRTVEEAQEALQAVRG
jgi:hypothetical protein